MTNLSEKLRPIEVFVKKEMDWLCSAHDFFHIERVVKLAKKIQEKEWTGDIIVITIWALMHESLDDKFFGEETIVSKKESLKVFLTSLDLTDVQIKNIMFIIENIWYWKSLERWSDFVYTREFEIVEDADRLETAGAMGIARTFAYGGKNNLEIYNPDKKPIIELTREQYRKEENTSINHFYEKLLLLKDLMHTNTWKEIAQERHEFMEKFLEQFFKEWNVELTSKSI